MKVILTKFTPSFCCLEVAISSPEGPPEDEFLPIPSLDSEESLDPDSAQPGNKDDVYMRRQFNSSTVEVSTGSET